MNQACDVDAFFRKCRQRFAEGSAAAADDLDFVDDRGCEVQRFPGRNSALEHHHAARANHLQRHFDPGGAAGAIDHHILIVPRDDIGQCPR